MRSMVRAVAVLVVVIIAVLAAPAFGAANGDCVGDPGDPAAGTPEWFVRELGEVPCGEQRASDTASNPLFAATGAQNLARDRGTVYEGDPFRDPTALEGRRFRYLRTSFVDPEGQRLAARVFLPCNASCGHMPAGLHRARPPYPAVIVVHGGSANQDMYDWGIEPLAEAGYMVLSFQVPTAENNSPTVFPADTKAALDFLTSRAFPGRSELDASRIGLAGHSAGGFAVSQVGQEDRRVSAIVSWDRAQSSPMRPGLPLRT